MKHNFQLFFIVSVLFVLLGLYNQDCTKSSGSVTEAEKIELAELQPGLLPDRPENTSHKDFSVDADDPDNDLCHTWKFQESYLSNHTNNRLAQCTRIFGSIKYTLICRTCQFQQHSSGEEIPS